MRFLCRWCGYGPEHDTWEPLSNLHEQLVHEFRESRATSSTVAAASSGAVAPSRAPPSVTESAGAASISQGIAQEQTTQWIAQLRAHMIGRGTADSPERFQRDVAAELGVSQSMLSQWLNRKLSELSSAKISSAVSAYLTQLRSGAVVAPSRAPAQPPQQPPQQPSQQPLSASATISNRQREHERRQREHERRVAEQSALVRALRHSFASEPALHGESPVFPALTAKLRGYRAEYGVWSDAGSLGARLLQVVARELETCDHIEAPQTPEQAKGRLTKVAAVVGFEDAAAFSAFVPGVNVNQEEAKKRAELQPRVGVRAAPARSAAQAAQANEQAEQAEQGMVSEHRERTRAPSERFEPPPPSQAQRKGSRGLRLRSILHHYIKACGGGDRTEALLRGFRSSRNDAGQATFIGPDGTLYYAYSAVARAFRLKPMSHKRFHDLKDRLLARRRDPAAAVQSSVAAASSSAGVKRGLVCSGEEQAGGPAVPAAAGVVANPAKKSRVAAAAAAPTGFLFEDDDGQPVYRVEGLLAARPRGDSREFLVRWDGFGADADSWEPESAILDANLIKAFDRQSSRAQERPRHANAGSGIGGGAWVAKVSRVGTEYQATRLPACVELAPLSALAEPPPCRCGVPAKFCYGRWWCALRCRSASEPPGHSDGGGTTASGDGSGDATALTSARSCRFEFSRSPIGTPTPLCDCSLPASWVANRLWLCASETCDFTLQQEPTALQAELQAERVSHRAGELQAATSTAALLTAAAFGPMNAWSFVGPCDSELGLFARVPLEPGQFVAEYSGPRLF